MVESFAAQGYGLDLETSAVSVWSMEPMMELMESR